MLPQDHRSPTSNQRWIEVYNGSGETIPPYSIVEIDDSSMDNGRTYVTVIKPVHDCVENFLVTGHQCIGAGKYGYATNDYPTYVAYDGTPVQGEDWGPQEGSFLAGKNRRGLKIVGNAHADATSGLEIVRVTRDLDAQAMIQIYDSGESEGYYLLATEGTSDGTATAIFAHPGKLKKVRSGLESSVDCWVAPINRFDDYSGEWPAVNHSFVCGFLEGYAEISSDIRPLYVAQIPEIIYDATVSESGGIDEDDSGTVELYWNGSTLSQDVTAHYKWIYPASNLPEDTAVRVRFQPDVYQLRIIDHECV